MGSGNLGIEGLYDDNKTICEYVASNQNTTQNALIFQSAYFDFPLIEGNMPGISFLLQSSHI